MQNEDRPIIIGVTGGSASGKTSVAMEIFSKFQDKSIALIQHDAYYKDQSHLPFEERLKTNYDHPFAFETDLLVKQLEQLSHREAVDIPVYDYAHHTRFADKVIHQEPKDVIILEGILVLDDARLRDLMDMKIFVDTDDDIRLIRRIKRDIVERGRDLDGVIEQYITTVKPSYHQFIEPTKRYADIIVPEGVTNLVAIDLINTKIKDFLRKRQK